MLVYGDVLSRVCETVTASASQAIDTGSTVSSHRNMLGNRLLIWNSLLMRRSLQLWQRPRAEAQPKSQAKMKLVKLKQQRPQLLVVFPQQLLVKHQQQLRVQNQIVLGKWVHRWVFRLSLLLVQSILPEWRLKVAVVCQRSKYSR